MAASLNQVILIGNLTEDPELQYTQSGVARTTFTIAINRQYRDANDELQEETTFVPITTWRNQAENCATYLSKGRPVAVTGRLRISNYEDDEGNNRKWTSVVAQNVQFLGSGQGERQEEKAEQPPPERPEPSSSDEDDEEIPF
ncbi:MAG: single-stranded DNA-binding protein [Candidatus Bipolaricaulota bacterium]|nr:single-stranded DNA-binding protein [Candidatus Bipolaricaulota bacterium]MBS3787701.1 single-stranded DNA-binding protein [Candidatus Bipolaricaulota bacterium]MBS3791181.1 single-stranded DNA-binding protein [Candidatus Bipolaricaulota bacterium]